MAQQHVAVMTEQGTHLTRCVIVIDVKSLIAIGTLLASSATDRAFSVLRRQHRAVLLRRQVVFNLQAILPVVIGQAFGVFGPPPLVIFALLSGVFRISGLAGAHSRLAPFVVTAMFVRMRELPTTLPNLVIFKLLSAGEIVPSRTIAKQLCYQIGLCRHPRSQPLAPEPSGQNPPSPLCDPRSMGRGKVLRG